MNTFEMLEANQVLEPKCHFWQPHPGHQGYNVTVPIIAFDRAPRQISLALLAQLWRRECWRLRPGQGWPQKHHHDYWQ